MTAKVQTMVVAERDAKTSLKLRNVNTLVAASLCVMALSGCSDRVREAESDMAAIRSESARPVEPPPKPQIVEDYVYNAGSTRSPFLPPSLLNRQSQVSEQEGVRPDPMRVKEPLESYELSQLIYRGILITPEGQQYGLVQRPDGVVMQVKVGDYMGLNDGRIVEITSNQINLIEIVPDSRMGYAERPATLALPI